MRARGNRLTALLLSMALALSLSAFAAGPYSDVTGTWAEEYVNRVTELGLMDGKTDGTFAPNENMTRADMVTALYRMAGSPAVTGSNAFTDVAEDAPYRNAVIWAAGQGFVNGRTATTFDPNGAIQRQELAKILNLYAAKAVEQESLYSREENLTAYPDANDAAAWARSGLNWAVACEFVNGSGGKLLPKGTATRAQVAAILCRYLDDVSTGDASLDKPRNGDGIGDNELLVVSFGTSFNDSRRLTIGAIEDALEKAFPDYSVRRGFTANIIIEHVQRRDGEVIDDVDEALDRAKANGVKNLLVQPTHLMNGFEYGDLVQELQSRAKDFETIKIGAPLLTTDADFTRVAEAMVEATKSYDDGKTAICFMGHGTEAASNGIYDKMQKIFTDGGHTNYFVGTVEAEPSVETVLGLVKQGGYERVVLRPMMIVAGDHANNDMAGDDEDSWKSVFEANGFAGKVICEVKGLGELSGVQQLLVEHAKDAKTLDSTGIDVEPNPENVKTQALADGTYSIEVACEQSMFRIDSCELTVKDGQMTAALTLGSDSFDMMYWDTAAKAELASTQRAEAQKDGEKTTFTLPVSALDTALNYAAHSVKNDRWYDRTLTFQADTAKAK